MDYKAFYVDVVEWIHQANQAAVRYGMHDEQFWKWVVDSSGALCKKYQNHRLAINQMLMLVEWLEEMFETNSHGQNPRTKETLIRNLLKELL